ncbi:aspartate aminotransferase family protein [Niveispirillum cyanobacteriorum]|uniref:Acetylornithine aminotransferase n=1 Tax=Niveispirillum cyanobacteriorum TaxID=1612173 RepID=A0A2K9NC20_9PROT|nr:aspartate aminotransferase family protein [Niveispirillum cyanobacteriorum]AUN30668.1 acetylornithine transaminase [Niveispirillum cyanobacteriorum]GGE52468.1 acetylornithine aminotransferase [Niveispirillum cyanobacteriorum]
MIPVVMPTYSRIDIVFERGEGAHIWDTTGRRFLDFTAGIAVNALGHAHPYLVEKLTEQAGKLWHTSNLFRVAGQEQLAKRLCDLTFADTMFFTNSGVEAFECAVKTVRKYQHDIGHPEKTRFIVVGGAFHGRSTTAIAAAKSEKMVGGFGPLLDAFDQVPFGNMNELRAAITPQTAAIVVEPILGEGGIVVGSDEYLKALRDTADEFGLLLVFDEIQTGVGRTGKMFAHEWAGVTPDVMPIAKGIGGGFPVGACLVSEKAAKGMVPGTHGSTFGGNPLAMAVANAVLDVITAPGFLEQVTVTGDKLKAELEALVAKYPTILAEARGKGLMLGLKCVKPNGEVVTRLRENGLLTVPAAENVIRILPPLTIGDAEIAEAVSIIDKTCQELAQ